MQANKKVFVIVNPVSSHGKTGKRWNKIMYHLQLAGLNFEYALTRWPGDAVTLCQDALKREYNVIVAVGGDGTLNEVVNGFFSVDDVTREKAALGIINMGTGGDFARTMQLPRDIPSAVRLIISGQPRLLDVGRIAYHRQCGKKEERYFCNIADVGLGGFMISRTKNNTRALGGALYFLLGTLVSMALYRNQEITAVIDDSIHRQEKIVILVAGNGQYFGGGMRIAPLAAPDDGFLDIVMITDINKFKLFSNLFRVYRGSHLKLKGVDFFRAKKIRIDSPHNVLLELDGEKSGNTPVEIELIPSVLNFIT